MEDTRILVVDDQPEFRAMLTVILQKGRFPGACSRGWMRRRFA